MLKSIGWRGWSDGALGTAKLIRKPTIAIAVAARPASHAGISPPSNWPQRMAMNVPASISPVPPMISCGPRCCGRIEYLMGPKMVEWMPIRNRQARRTGIDSNQKPAIANTMMAISAAFTQRTNCALSYASASCPAIDENRK